MVLRNFDAVRTFVESTINISIPTPYSQPEVSLCVASGPESMLYNGASSGTEERSALLVLFAYMCSLLYPLEFLVVANVAIKPAVTTTYPL